MAPTLDASSPAAVYSDVNGTGTLVTASFTPPSGSIVVAKAATGDSGTYTVSSITGSALTFTSRVNNSAASNTAIAIFTATGGGSATTVTASFTGAGAQRGLVVEVWTGAQLAATPATHNVQGSGAPSDTITTVAANSIVSWISGDWAAIDGTSRAYRSSATEKSYHFLSGSYTLYTAYQSAATAGSQTYGLTAPTGQTFNMAAIEVQASSGAPAIPPFLTMQTRRSY